jgi:PAS domain S-box-containing protein
MPNTAREDARFWLKQFRVPLLLSVPLIGIAQFNFLLFHTLAEFFAVFVAFLIGVVAWNTFQFSRNHYLMYLGCGYLWVGLLDTLHTLTFPGVGVFPISDMNTTLSFWIGTRLLEVLVLLTAPFFLRHSLWRTPASVGFGLFSLLLILGVWRGVFPELHVPDVGLTPTKVYSEYLIIVLLGGAILHLWFQRRLIEPRILALMYGSIGLTMISELMFTQYVNPSDTAIMVGHLFKLTSFWLIYAAVVQTGLKEPFRILARSAHTYDAIPLPVLLVDKQGRVHEANHEALRYAGRSEHELLGQGSHALYHDPALNEADCPVCKAIHSGRTGNHIVPLQDSAEWREITLSPVRSAGLHQGMVQVIRDISEQKRNEAAIIRHHQQLQSQVQNRTKELEENRRILSNLISNLPGAVYRCWNDDHWTMLFMSDGIRSLTGYSAQSFLDGQISLGKDIIHPEERERVWREVQEGLQREGIYQLTYRIRTADGETRWAWEKGIGIYDAQGNLLSLEGIITDMTDRKQAEHALQLTSSRLELMNRELEGFNYSVSHDLRGPLRAIDGFSLILEEEYGDRLDVRAHDYLQRVRRAAQKMGCLIDDLLQLSRLGRGELARDVVDLGDLARQSVSHLQEMHPGMEVEILIEDGLRTQGDRGLLQVAMDNLLGNAWKYSSRKDKVHIQVGSMPHNGTPAFFVRDQGAGFNMDYADKLFGAFQRLHGDDEYEGTGIGLATVQRIIQRHGGRIWAESSLGAGSTFYFTLWENPPS